MHPVGSIPHGTEIDVPLNYADYYFLEALNQSVTLKKAHTKLYRQTETFPPVLREECHSRYRLLQFVTYFVPHPNSYLRVTDPESVNLLVLSNRLSITSDKCNSLVEITFPLLVISPIQVP